MFHLSDLLLQGQYKAAKFAEHRAIRFHHGFMSRLTLQTHYGGRCILQQTTSDFSFLDIPPAMYHFEAKRAKSVEDQWRVSLIPRQEWEYKSEHNNPRGTRSLYWYCMCRQTESRLPTHSGYPQLTSASQVSFIKTFCPSLSPVSFFEDLGLASQFLEHFAS